MMNSFTRFVPREPLKLTTDNFMRVVAPWVFKDLTETSDMSSTGLTSIDDIMDVELKKTSPARGNLLAFTVRTDKRSVPAAALKLEVRKAWAAELARTGAPHLSRARKKEISDQVAFTRRIKAPAVPKSVPVIIDQEHQIVYVGTTSTTTLDNVCMLFASVFSVGLDQVDHYVLADRMLQRSAQKDIHRIIGDDPQAGHRLGQDFLLWLWFQSDTGGQFHNDTVPDSTETFALSVSGRVEMEGQQEKVTFTGTADSDYRPAKYAVRAEEKRLSSLSLKIDADTGQEWRLRLNTLLVVSGLKTPPALVSTAPEDWEAAFLERFWLMVKPCEFIDSLFSLFLRARLSGRWAKEYQNIVTWLMESAPECANVLTTTPTE